MTAVVEQTQTNYHQQTTRYHYKVDTEVDDLTGEPSTQRQLELANEPGKKSEWKKIQQKTFTNWVNERLKVTKASSVFQVMSLKEDMADGVILAKLLEVLSKKKVKGVQKNPTLKAHCIDNLAVCLDFMRSEENIKLVSIHPEEIYKGNMTIIMGLIWTLIQRYQIKTSGVTITTRRVMMDWLVSMLPEWGITNMTTDFNDGRALLCLVDRIKPGIIPKNVDPTKRRQNCALAINQARTHLKIPALITHDDMSNPNVDDLSMMTYLSEYLQPSSLSLMKWVKKTLGPTRTVKNFTTDWNDGTKLAALLEAKFPSILPDANGMSPADARDNIEKCYEVMEQRLGILPNLEIADLMNPLVDEVPVMTLLTYIRYGQLSPLPDLVRMYGSIGDKPVSVGQTCEFTVDVTEAGPGKLYIDAYYITSGTAVKVARSKNGKYHHVAKFTPTEAGTINFDVLWSETPVPNSPFAVEVMDAHPVKLLGKEKLQGPLNVDQPIELMLDASAAPPAGAPKAYVQYGFGAPVEAAVVSLGDGKYGLRFVPPNEGVPKLHVTYGGKEMEHLKQDLKVVDYRRFSVIPIPEGKQFKTFERVEFGVRSDGPSLNNLNIMAICGDVQVPFNVESEEGHVGTVAFTPTVAGVYSIEVACGDRLVSGSPFVVDVIDPSQVYLENKIPKYLHIGVPFEFKLNAGNAGPGIPNVSVEDRALEDVFNCKYIEDEVRGTLSAIVLTPKEYGEFVLSLTWSGSHVTGSPFRVAVCDPSKCAISGDLAEKKAYLVGRPITFAISTRDAWINDNMKPVILARGPSAKLDAEIKQIEPYKFSATLIPYEVGNHTFSIQFGDRDVPKSPINVVVMKIGSGCSATGSGLRQAYTGIPATFQILAGNSGLVDTGIIKISVMGVVTKKECKVRVRDNQNGMYDVAYLTEVPGAYLIHITQNDTNIPGSPFKLNAREGPDPTKCVMDGPALQPNAILQIGKPIDFHVDTSKAGNGPLQVKAVGPKGIQARVYTSKSDKPGVNDIRVDPIRHGKYRVSTRFANKHIPKSPFMIKVFPGADPTKCKAYGPGLQDGLVGSPGIFIVETRDAGAGTLQVRLHGVKDAFKIDIKPRDPSDIRTLEANYHATKPGDYLITIKWSDVHIPGSPFRVRLTGDALDQDDNLLSRPTPKEILSTIEEHQENYDELEETGQAQKNKKQKKTQFSATLPRDAKINVQDIPAFDPLRATSPEDLFTEDSTRKSRTVSQRSNIKSSSSMNFNKSKTISEKNNMIYNTHRKQQQVEEKIEKKMKKSTSFTN